MPLSLDVPNLSLEKCVRVQTLLCHPDYPWTPPTSQEDLANGRPNLDCHTSFYFWFQVIGFCLAPVAPLLVCHFALLLGIEAPESTANPRSSGLFEVGARHHPGFDRRVKT